jgi:hypothetical protein
MLEAVRLGNVRIVDADLFTRPGPDMARAAALLAEYLRALCDGDGSPPLRSRSACGSGSTSGTRPSSHPGLRRAPGAGR